jgi:TRAP-type C4-dicarboxylate transport system substrate-binding protein
MTPGVALKKLITTLLLALTLTAQAQPLVMKIASPVSGDVSNEWMRVFKAGVEKRAGGRLRVELYPAGQLGQIQATIEGVAMGTIELTIPAVGFLAGIEPRFQVLDAPGLFDSVEHGQRVLASIEMRQRLADFGRNKGVEPLFVFVASPTLLLSQKPVLSLADMRGMKVRAPGGTALYTEPLKALGVSPISMSLGEVLPALQNGTIEGATSGYAPFVGFKYFDVAKHLTPLPGSFLVAAGLANRAFLKSLGPELEQIVREESRRAESVFSDWGAAELGRLQKTWAANGGQVHPLPAAEQQRYIERVAPVVRNVLSTNAQLREDYEALLTASRRQR